MKYYGKYDDPKDLVPKEYADTKQKQINLYSLSLPTASWTATGDNWMQAVVVTGTTANSKIDIQMDVTALAQMITDGTSAIYISNNDGSLTAYAVGGKPSANLSVQVTRTEVSV